MPHDRVTADMERIFRPLGERPRSSSFARPLSTSPAPRRIRLLAGVLLLIAATAGAVLLGGDDFVRRPALNDAAPFARAKTPLAAMAVPRGSPPAASRAERTADAEDVTSRTMQLASVEIRPSTLDAHTKPSVRTAAIVGSGPRRPIETALPRADETTSRGADVPRCHGQSVDECLYQEVLDADDRLRRAYTRAVRSGVAEERLDAINRRWSRAREEAVEEPGRTIDRYDRLAGLLDEERWSVTR